MYKHTAAFLTAHKVISDDEIDEQRIFRAPAITLPDHREAYNAQCGGLQAGEGKPHVDKSRHGIGKRVFFRTSFMDNIRAGAHYICQ